MDKSKNNIDDNESTDIGSQMRELEKNSEPEVPEVKPTKKNLKKEKQAQEQKVADEKKTAEGSGKIIDINSFSQPDRRKMRMSSTSTKNSRMINLNETTKKKVELNGGSYALIYKSQTPSRIVPFVWQQDFETRQQWAVFDLGEFDGKPKQAMPLKNKFLVIPFDKSPEMCDYFGRGYLAKFDEISRRQIRLNLKDTPQELDKRLEDQEFVSKDLTLYRMLSKYGQAKFNWRTILIIVAVLGVAILLVWFFYSHPDVLSNLSKMFTGGA